nr:MAG TPA: hypothetical protein [Caudoviricetes sp.]
MRLFPVGSGLTLFLPSCLLPCHSFHFLPFLLIFFLSNLLIFDVDQEICYKTYFYVIYRSKFRTKVLFLCYKT